MNSDTDNSSDESENDKNSHIYIILGIIFVIVIIVIYYVTIVDDISSSPSPSHPSYNINNSAKKAKKARSHPPSHPPSQHLSHPQSHPQSHPPSQHLSHPQSQHLSYPQSHPPSHPPSENDRTKSSPKSSPKLKIIYDFKNKKCNLGDDYTLIESTSASRTVWDNLLNNNLSPNSIDPIIQKIYNKYHNKISIIQNSRTDKIRNKIDIYFINNYKKDITCDQQKKIINEININDVYVIYFINKLFTSRHIKCIFVPNNIAKLFPCCKQLKCCPDQINDN